MPMNADLMADAIIKYMPSLDEEDARDARRAAVKAMCQGIIDHIRANLTLTIQSNAAGLQTTTGPGSPTGPPPLPVPLQAGGNMIVT